MHKEVESIDNSLRGNRLVRINPIWYSFIKYCETLDHGEIDKLKIKDGLPMLAEEVKKKVKFPG